MKYDTAIIGRGPAGLQAALYTCRAGLSTVVIGKDEGALAGAAAVENFFGQEKPVSGAELLDNTKKQAERLGAVIVTDEIFHIDFAESFLLEGKYGTYEAEAVLIATGSQRKSAPINGLAALEGHGVSYCAVCDAFFYRGKRIAVIGNADYAMSELRHLIPVASESFLLTNGPEPTAEVPDRVTVYTGKISTIDGTERVEGVTFEDGSTLPLDGVFVAYGSAGATELARKAGAFTEGKRVVTDDGMATAVPGLFAAGDCTGGLLQISTAVGEGAKAAMSIIRFVRGKRKG